MIKVEMYLYDSVERELIGTALNAIEARRLTIQQAMGGNAAPGQRVPDAEPNVGDQLVAAAAEAVVEKKSRKKKAEVVQAIAPEAPAPITEEEAPLRPQPHGGALKSGGGAAPKKQETEVVVTTEAPAVSLDDARSKLQAYAEKNGLPAASKLLAEFGAKRIGDVPANRLAAFIGRLA